MNTKKYTYVWSGHTKHNKKIFGEIEDFSLNLAKIHLRRQGITAISIQKKTKKFFSRNNVKISSLDVAIFFRQLATLITANIPIVQSCEILSRNQEKFQLKKLILSLKQEIESGKNLTKALQKFPRYFDDITCQLVHAGEKSGTLETMLKRIAQYKEKSIRLKKQILQALFYPTIIFIVAIIVSIMLLTLVVPRFADLFNTMHGHLPTFTLYIIALSNFMRSYAYLGILPLLAVILLSYFFKNSIRMKNKIDHLLLCTPFLGNLLKKIILARFSRNLATTFAAGVPITDALHIIAKISGNSIFTQAIMTLQKNVNSGQQLHLAMQQNPLFPAMPIQMIKIGEETGSLEHMLEKIAEWYEADIDHFIANLSQLLEPLIMIILGVLIGGLVIAMYLPIFKLGTVL